MKLSDLENHPFWLERVRFQDMPDYSHEVYAIYREFLQALKADLLAKQRQCVDYDGQD